VQKPIPGSGQIASEVLPWLFVGGEHAASRSVLRENGIGYVLNCCQNLPFASQETHNQKVPLQDLPNEQLASHLPQAFAFMDRAKAAGGKCLVHCRMGISRSVSVVLAYLVMRQGRRLSQAWEHMTTCHPAARPNRGFVEQLIDLDFVLHGPTLCLRSEDILCRTVAVPIQASARTVNMQVCNQPETKQVASCSRERGGTLFSGCLSFVLSNSYFVHTRQSVTVYLQQMGRWLLERTPFSSGVAGSSALRWHAP